MKLTDNDIKPWPSWRINRLLRMLEYKSKGLTDKQVSKEPGMPSEVTVNRELNSPQAAKIGRDMIERALGMIWPLIEKQIYQIENDELKPGARIQFRGGLINSLFRLVPQKIEADIKGKGIAPIVISFDKDTELIYPPKEETDADDPAV